MMDCLLDQQGVKWMDERIDVLFLGRKMGAKQKVGCVPPLFFLPLRVSLHRWNNLHSQTLSQTLATPLLSMLSLVCSIKHSQCP